MALSPRESGNFVVKHAKYLQVNDEGIDNLSKQIVAAILDKSLDINNFSQHDLHPSSNDEVASIQMAANWIFLVDTLNFCFWSTGSDDTKYRVQGETGYFALCASVNRARKEGIDMLNPAFYVTITLEQLEKIMRSDDGQTKVPLLEERVKCLHEVGQMLLDKYDGQFLNCIKLAENSSEKLLKLIVEDFPCFRDEAVYNKQRVAIYKRAQILVGDIWACFRGEKTGYFKDISTAITMFADYRVPQVLVHFGSLIYSDELMQDLKSNKIFINGEAKEVEIRAASIYIVELAKDKVLAELAKNHPEVSTKNVNSILLDHFLWDYRRVHAKELEYIPFHKTYSIYY
ncbi:unnamed protein product [Diamesa hyperborea]